MKNNLYNQKMNSNKRKPQMQFSFGDKINLYKKKNIQPKEYKFYGHTN